MNDRQSLPESALGSLAELTEAVRRAEASVPGDAARIRIHFLRNFTLETIDPYLRFHLLRDAVYPTISYGGYGTMAQELLREDADLVADPPDVIVLALLAETLDPRVGTDAWDPADALDELSTVLGLLLDRTPSLVIANTFIPPLAGADAARASAAAGGIARLSAFVDAESARNPARLRVIDWNALLGGLGPGAIDHRFWKSSLAPFRASFLDAYARRIAGLGRARIGRSKKCLVLDCDNTLWGGVVGEDGPEGIALGGSAGPGRYFREFQSRLVELHGQGVMLALLSKNDEADVWHVLDRHPHCLLRKSHLVGWRIDWRDKASNLAELAQELNIGLDSIVFVDDSPQERELIRQVLPAVTVLAVPADLAAYPALLDRDGWFESIASTPEDRQRTQMYREEAERRSGRGRYVDLTDYLRSLETRIRVARLADQDLERVGQLVRKTNQFNLTTRRHSDADIRRMATQDAAAVFTMRVEDRYGDMGLTGVLIATRDGGTAVIDTLLLSCRVLGRQLEFAFVDQCMALLREQWSIDRWVAEYIPTGRNVQVADFWPAAGFECTATTDVGRRYEARGPCIGRDYLNIIDVRLE